MGASYGINFVSDVDEVFPEHTGWFQVADVPTYTMTLTYNVDVKRKVGEGEQAFEIQREVEYIR